MPMINLLKIFFIFAFILTIPIIIICLILVWLEDGLPTVFVQKRLGKNKKQFNLYKIRTMDKSTPSEATHNVSKSHHLKSAYYLRKFKIDELPQSINYIKGDILLVGPRPGLPNQEELKKFRDRYNVFSVKPGITGLAQVLGYDMRNAELLAYVDSLYIKHRTIKLDITIFFATFFRALRMQLKLKYNHSIQNFEDKIKHV